MAQEVKLTMDGTLLNWLKQAGEAVKKGEIIAEFEADKATVEVESPSDGVVLTVSGAVGDELKEGTVIATVGASGEGASNGAPANEAPPKEAAPVAAPVAPSNGASSVTADGRVKASPLAKRIAEDKGINLAQVQGTGPDGRIVKADVEGFTPSATPAPTKTAETSAPAPVAVGGRNSYGKLPEGDDVEIIDVNKMRKAIADGTTLSKQTTPHFYVTVEIDVDALLALRAQLNKDLESDGIKISVNDMLVKAAALTLKKFPNLNTHFYGDKVVRYKRINIGISVALPNNGLVNAVSPDADKVSLSTMAKYHAELFARVREGNIRLDDIKGATFSISNLGPYDVDQFVAIIATPEAAMLAISSAKKVPVVKPDGSLGVGNRMKATISVDHRVSDGAEAAQFMQLFRQLVESPMRLLV